MWSDKEILGAVVVKINMAPIERSWADSGAELIVTDPDGVIFITTHPQWRFKTLSPLPDVVHERIRENRRYGDAELTNLAVSFTETLMEGARIMQGGDGLSTKYLVLEKAMPQAGWKVHIIKRLEQIDAQVAQATLFVAIFMIVVLLLIFIWLQRRRRLAEHSQFEKQAKHTLETRVREQTRDITDANIRLTREIEQHRRTERELQRTQNELIQSAKLAVIGQMSTGITHELNQPLAAIRSYADNARALFRRGRGEELEWNLAQISELTERMAQIGSQLKLFARKTSGQSTSVSVEAVVDDSLRLLDSRIRKSGTDVLVNLREKGPLYVTADMVRLEQVLVNLIGNALHAMEQVEKPKIYIDGAPDLAEGTIKISIRDKGPGIPEELIERIFDPFFTTKEEGRGLGLGLSISQRIIEALDGALTADNHPDGGAIFILTLPTSASPED